VGGLSNEFQIYIRRIQGQREQLLTECRRLTETNVQATDEVAQKDGQLHTAQTEVDRLTAANAKGRVALENTRQCIAELERAANIEHGQGGVAQDPLPCDPAQPPANQVPPINPVTGNPYKCHPYPKGMTDAKGIPFPTPFDGTGDDACPLLTRIKAHCSLQPKKYFLTSTRILVFNTLITKEPAKTWATAITKSISEGTQNKSYTEEWAVFEKGFVQGFGIVQEDLRALMKIEHIQQGTLPFETFLAQFLDLQHQSKVQDLHTITYFTRGL
jgi:hypothetical protein